MLGEWTGASVKPGDEKPEPELWTPVDDPGRATLFDDAEAVAYRTEFDDPRSPDEERAVIILRGLYAHARIWLNGQLLGSHDTYFRPFRASFEPDDENELIVECRAPEDRFGGIHDTDLVPEDAAVPGIWWDARLETHPGTFFYNLEATPHFVDGAASIDVRAVVETTKPIDDRITFSLRPEGEFQSRGMMDRASVQAEAGERVVVEHTIDVRDPSLWWPRGLGPQHRYTVRAKLDDIRRSVTTGLCSVTRRDSTLFVNGEQFSARGFTLLSATPDDIDRAVEANANVVRMHAHVPSQAVYDACSDAGVLVWQDLPLTGPGTFDVDRGQTLATELTETYGRYPCLQAFSVVDDPIDPFPEPIGSGFLDRLRLRWRIWRTSYDHEPAEQIATELPDDLLVFPVAGPLGSDPDAAHLYPGWDYGDASDIDWLCDTYGLGEIVGAFGAGALGSGGLGRGEGERDSTAESVDEDNGRRNPAGPVTAGFDRHKHAFHVPDDQDSDASQRYQASVLKRVAEALRRRDTALLTACALRDTGDAGMGVLKRDGTEKKGYRALQSAFEPVQAILDDPTARRTDVTIINETPESISGTLQWDTKAEVGETDVSVNKYNNKTVTTVPLPDTSNTVTLSLSIDDKTIENKYDWL